MIILISVPIRVLFNKSFNLIRVEIRVEITVQIRVEINVQIRVEISAQIRVEISAQIRVEISAQIRIEISAQIRIEISIFEVPYKNTKKPLISPQKGSISTSYFIPQTTYMWMGTFL